MSDLPSGFHRAAAQWLEPPEYRPSPDDISEDITRVCTEANNILQTFSDEYCGGIEESYHIEATIKEAKILIDKLKPLAEELQEYEEMESGPDPDAFYDNCAATGEVI